MSKRYQAGILTASYNGLKVPNAPTIGTATAGAGSASVTFTAPSDVGGGAITSYTVISSPGSITGTGSSSPVTVSGLTNGTAYTFTVVATNAYGTGPASAASNSVTPSLNYIEEVFSTYLYTGNGSTQTITNGIDLSTKGGLVWWKNRTNATGHGLIDTTRGIDYYLSSNTTDAQDGPVSYISSVSSTGYSIGAGTQFVNQSANNYVSWTFRKQPKFFDVVTYTGNGTNGRTVAHSLGSTPGCIIVKRTDAANGWAVYHRAMNASPQDYMMRLNATDGAFTTTPSRWNNTLPTSTEFTLSGNDEVNGSGGTYVAYLFAHNAGGFGASGSDNVISCGSFTTDGSGNATVNLGYEPQWVLYKRSSSAGNWLITDNMRGDSANATNNANYLLANTSDAEGTATWFYPTATGFTGNANSIASTDFIYIAIRRGPMKVPTSGTSVFYPNAVAQADSPDSSNVPFPPDLVNTFSRDGVDRYQSNQFNFVDRLRGLGTPNNTYTASGPALTSSSTIAESSAFPYVQLKADSQNITRGSGWNSASYGNWIYYFMRRAPSFFDEVCYTGTGSATTVTHNLQAVPQLILVKQRTASPAGSPFTVYSATLGNTGVLFLNSDGGNQGPDNQWNSTTPTSSVFSLGSSLEVNQSGSTFVAYLFATCAGVSKVGSYTGTGTTLQIDCGFTSGARFVLIKRSGTGDWYVWDSARGIVAGNDPYLLLNSTAAEVTNTDYVDTYSAGFEISSTAPAAINANGGTYIYLAIA